ncbi:MAG: hypothetical protein WCK53_15465, partial [Methanomicrobiales archaeon]
MKSPILASGESWQRKLPVVRIRLKKFDGQGNRTTTLFCMSRFSWGTSCRKYETKLPNSDHNS